MVKPAILPFLFLLVFMIPMKSTISIVYASPEVYQGNLILNGNNVTVIEGRFDINGSIIVEENATLILRNAVLNFTQTADYQFNITFRNPVNGNPRFIVENSTVNTNEFYVRIYFYGNSTADIFKLKNYGYYWRISLVPYDYSVLKVSNSTLSNINPSNYATVNVTYSSVYAMHPNLYSSVNVCNSENGILSARYHVTITALDSNIYSYVSIYAHSVNCSIDGLQPGLFTYWNFEENCSAVASSDGWIPNFTIINTNVNLWSFTFQGKSNATLSNSSFSSVDVMDSSVVSAFASNAYSLRTYSSSKLYVYNSSTNYAYLYHNSEAWSINSTCTTPYFYDQARVYVCWYLSVQILDMLSTAVPYANVTVTYQNATVADSKLTNTDGWAKFVLAYGMTNATGVYPMGNYNVTATYDFHSTEATVEMSTNHQITLTLEFVLPEFPATTLVLLLILATLAVRLFNKRQQKAKSINSSKLNNA